MTRLWLWRLRGTARLEITVGSAVAAWYWQSSGLLAGWFLRGDVIHEHPMLLFTRADDGTVHATSLVPGKPVRTRNRSTRSDNPMTTIDGDLPSVDTDG